MGGGRKVALEARPTLQSFASAGPARIHPRFQVHFLSQPDSLPKTWLPLPLLIDQRNHADPLRKYLEHFVRMTSDICEKGKRPRTDGSGMI